MNLLPAKITLEKIIALYNSMTADEKNVSTIERDLMLSYIRQLYETFREAQIMISPIPPVQKSNQIITPTPTVVKAESRATEQIYQPSAPAVAIETTRAPEVKREERSYTPEPPKYVAPEPPKYIAPEPPKPEPPKYVAPEPLKQQPAPRNERKINPEIIALFESDNSNELSDRIANASISDLTKNLGLNDRLLNQNELFGGSKVVFDEALKDLNNMSSFDTARAFLEDIGVRNNWSATEDRKKVAKIFIRYVKRRFA